jgi:hypothetical protein
MVNAIRTSCHYKDEYIMEKPIRWVRSTYELCLRSQYDNSLQLAHMVLHLYASGMSKEVEPPKSFGQMMKAIKDKKTEGAEQWFADENTLAGLGIKVKKSIRKPKKSSEKGTPASPPPSETTKSQ